MYEVQQRGKNKFFACVMYGYALSDALWIPKRQEEHQLCEWEKQLFLLVLMLPQTIPKAVHIIILIFGLGCGSVVERFRDRL